MKNCSLEPEFKRILPLFALLLLPLMQAEASSFMPLITNYAATAPMSRTQTWATCQNENGVMFFGTSDGLVRFDGNEWMRYAVPGSNNIRSVYVEGSRIYVGSYQEFGFFDSDDTGNLTYTSLSASLSRYPFRDEEIWKIFRFEDKIYFQSFRNWFTYNGKEVLADPAAEISPLYLFQFQQQLYAQRIDGGLLRIGVKSQHEVVPRSTFGNDNVVAMLTVEPQKAILCTERHGLFTFDGRNVKPFRTDADSRLRAEQINRAILTHDGHIAIGTIENGVYYLNADGSLEWNYNTDNGLGNNSVLGLYEDSDRNIWVVMDYGIALIHTSLPYSILTPGANEPYIGMAYDCYLDGDKLLIGTNQGLYSYSFGRRAFDAEPLIRSQIWHVGKHGKQIFAGNNTVSHIYSNGADRKYPVSSTDIKYGRIHGQEVLVESSYYHLRIYTRNPQGDWEFSHNVEGFGTPVRQLEIDATGGIWCAHMALGVKRVELTPDLKRIASQDFTPPSSSNALNTEGQVFVLNIMGNIAVAASDSLYIYRPLDNRMEPWTQFNDDLPGLTRICGVSYVNDRLFWVSTRSQYCLVEYDGSHFRRVQTVPLEVFMLNTNGVNNRVFVADDGYSYFTLNNGVGRISHVPDTASEALPRVSLQSAVYLSENGDEIRLPLDSEKLPEVPGSVSFHFCCPNYNCMPSKYRYELRGSSNPPVESDVPDFAVGSLGYGKYTLVATLLDGENNAVMSIEYPFAVKRPAHLSWWAILLYIIGIAALVLLGVYGAGVYKARRRKHLIQMEKVSREVEILEQERVNSDRQREMLETELSVKSKELASMALDMSAKQAIIDNLKDTISMHRRKGSFDSREIDNLLRQINSDLGDSEFWSIFEKNFDLIHEHFFRNLRAQYPSLTSGDMKFCALLRLNLSTKDIAKFTNLTVRGVETARYRLRRKFDIPEKSSLVQFLIDFK